MSYTKSQVHCSNTDLSIYSLFRFSFITRCSRRHSGHTSHNFPEALLRSLFLPLSFAHDDTCALTYNSGVQTDMHRSPSPLSAKKASQPHGESQQANANQPSPHQEEFLYKQLKFWCSRIPDENCSKRGVGR